MIKFVVCFAVVALAAASPLGVQVEDVNDVDNALDSQFNDDQADTRMVGGEKVTDNSSLTFMIAIKPRYLTPTGQLVQAPVCSGVLISGTNSTVAPGVAQNWVLTSAHCALSGTVYDLFAGSKTITFQLPDDTVPATMTVVNSEYRASQLTGDIALIPTSIQAGIAAGTNKQISTALLANVDDAGKSYLINTVSMAGWGYPNDVFTGQSSTLRQLSSWVVPNWYCAVRHLTLPIKRSHMCTAGLPNKGPCTGDSGAPLIAQVSSSDGSSGGTRVIGLATLTPENGCNRGKPGVFTRVGTYLSWIQQVTGYDVEQA